MTTKPVATIGVLTGDLINSTGVADPGAYTARLQRLLGEVEKRWQARSVTYRGDGFQITLSDPAWALDCALYMRAGLIAASPGRPERWDARVSVAIAGARGPRGGDGDAYIQSGRGLDSMSDGHLCLYADSPVFRLATGISTALVDDIIDHWTPSEAEVYFEHLREPGGHREIARRLDKSRPTITKALLRARYNLLDRYRRDTLELLELIHAR